MKIFLVSGSLKGNFETSSHELTVLISLCSFIIWLCFTLAVKLTVWFEAVADF